MNGADVQWAARFGTIRSSEFCVAGNRSGLFPNLLEKCSGGVKCTRNLLQLAWVGLIQNVNADFVR